MNVYCLCRLLQEYSFSFSVVVAVFFSPVFVKEVEVVAKRLGVTFVDLHLALSGSGVNLRDALR